MLRTINNARVVTPEGVREGASVVLEDGKVAGISARAENGGGEVLDAAGRYVLPGIVDLHSDAIEKQLTPRPGVEFSPELAFLEMDRYFMTSGVTTGFHALSFMEGNGRTLDRGRELCELVERLRNEGLARHEVHVRCELPDKGSSDAVEEVLRSSRVGIVSVMDHTPGQGQFRDLEWFRRYWMQDRGAGESQVAAAIEEARANGYSLHLDRVERIAGAAADRGTLFASHDDDTPERVELLAEKGVSISEFPVNARSASRARELGLSVCMGAPNAVRGVSSGGNLCATEAVELGLVDALCSDYHPPSLLQAVFELARKRAVPLPAAVALVTSGPARAAGLPDRGEVREGAKADLIVVGESLGLPTVTHTVVSGEVASARGGAPAHRALVDERDGRARR